MTHTIKTDLRPDRDKAIRTVRFAALDSLRGIAAIMVVLFHSQIVSHVRDSQFIRGSEIFVDFFFVLSGFVIAHSYLNRLSSEGALVPFMIRRFGRLYPLHLFMLGLFVAFELGKAYLPVLANPADPAFSGTNELAYLPSNLLLLQALFPVDTLSWNTPSWSISAELVVYALFALAAIRGRWALGVWIVASLLGAPILLELFSTDGMNTTVGLSVLRALFGFAAGVLLYRTASGTILRARHSGVGRMASNRSLWTALELATVCAVAMATIHMHNSDLAYLLPLVFAVAVGIFAVERGAVSRLLKLRPFVVVGALSYSIYMTHMFVLLRLTNVARLSDSQFDTALLSEIGRTARYGVGIDTGSLYAGDMLVAAVVAMTICVSYGTWRLIEMPGQRLFSRLADGVSKHRGRGQLSASWMRPAHKLPA